MKNVLLTGGTGFIGRNIKSNMETYCNLFAPTRKELNLLDQNCVSDFIQRNNIDIVIHSANPNPVKNDLDKTDLFFEDSIRMFENLLIAEKYYERMYTFGSGAEYAKTHEIDNVKESDIGRFIPEDTYGLIKYTINKMIETSSKQYNLRLFAVYGPTDHSSKFITHVIRCILNNEDITIRQDCKFDYMHVSDLSNILDYFINHIPKFYSYNIVSGKEYYLSQIAELIKNEMKSDAEIVINKEGFNNSYTADNSRLLEEIGHYEFKSLRQGIFEQIEYEKSVLYG